MALVSYVPKKGKNVLLLSTKHREPQVEEVAKKRPQTILDYNRCKGKVDNLDRVSTRFVFSITFYKTVLSSDVLQMCVANTEVAHVPVLPHG